MAAYKAEGGLRFPKSDYALTPEPLRPSTWKLRLCDTPGQFSEARVTKLIENLPSSDADTPEVRMRLREVLWQLNEDAELPAPLAFKDYSTEQRRELAKKGQAKPDLSYPIADKEDLQNAIRSWGRGGATAADKAWIIKRARALGATDMLPADWSGSTKQESKTAAEPQPAGAATGQADAGDNGQPDDDDDDDDMHGASDAPAGDGPQPDDDDVKGAAVASASGNNFSLMYLRGLRDELRQYVPDATFNAAVRKVRSSVGGRARYAQKGVQFGELDELEIIFTDEEPDFGKVELLAESNPDGMFSMAEDGDGFRLFNEVGQYTEPPEWIPLMPKPGRYSHSQYGTIELTPERNADFVAKLKAQVYQDRLPVDAEHQSKLSGAMAWITDARQLADGSVQGRVDWTPRGRKLVEADAFRYVSPEIYDEWEDNATNEKHSNVLIGAALTTRPFFKHRDLAPLVATEHGMYAPVMADDNKTLQFTAMRFTQITGERVMPREDPKPSGEGTGGSPPARQPSATIDPARFAELEDKVKKFDEVAAENGRLKQLTEKLGTDLSAVTDELRGKRFTDLVMGRGGEGDGAPWFGEVEKNVTLLKGMADKFGEDSDEFKAYVEQQKQVGAAMLTDGRLQERGSGQPGTPNVESKLHEIAKKFQESDAKLTDEQAMAKALDSDEGSKLYTEFKRGRKEAIP